MCSANIGAIAEATREALRDGWYRTGDIGRRDADGYFWVHDRKKNLIISGGENIYPAEVERVLLEHPDVAECGVIGRPDPRWDEVPVAYVIRRAGCTVEAEGLKAHVLTQLARFKVPRDIVFVDDLPRTALGKVQHFMLRQSTRWRWQERRLEDRRARRRQRFIRGRGRFCACRATTSGCGGATRTQVAAHRAAGSRILRQGCQRPPRGAAGAGDVGYRRGRRVTPS